MLNDELRKKLREFRKISGFTQQEIAEKLGIDRSTYAYYESGRTQIPTLKLFDLALIYNIDVSDFGETDMIALNDPNKTKNEKSEMGKLTRDEREIVALYRLLASDSKQYELKQFLKELNERDKKQ
ncbi:MAG: helix-turn-helix transcriptional regulator [Oscillospiraceae bacterium]|nr:helix-turn-helix transcriptional regulator [Oscillospiraceae bacterium]